MKLPQEFDAAVFRRVFKNRAGMVSAGRRKRSAMKVLPVWRYDYEEKDLRNAVRFDAGICSLCLWG